MDDGDSNPKEAIADEARRWVVHMASGAMDGDDLDRFKTWREEQPAHNRAFEEQRRLWRAADPAQGLAPRVPVRPARGRERGWTRRRTGLMTAGAVAAAVAFALVGSDAGVMLRADHHAGIAVDRVALPDGSVAVLDAGTAITVRYGEGERRIELLRGDAWFRVAHGDDRPFRVAALGGIAEDVGTAFVVDRTPGAVTVSVTEGAAKVANGGGAFLLTATQRAQYQKGDAPVRLTNMAVADIAPWRNGEILLRRADIRSAIVQIGLYRRGPVYVIGHTADRPQLSGSFRTDRADEAIDAIASMARMTVYRFAGITILRPAD